MIEINKKFRFWFIIGFTFFCLLGFTRGLFFLDDGIATNFIISGVTIVCLSGISLIKRNVLDWVSDVIYAACVSLLFVTFAFLIGGHKVGPIVYNIASAAKTYFLICFGIGLLYQILYLIQRLINK